MPLRITIELIPGGNEATKRTLGVLQIERCGEVRLVKNRHKVPCIQVADYRVQEMYEAGGIRGYTLNGVNLEPYNIFKFLRNILREKKGLILEKDKTTTPEKR